MYNYFNFRRHSKYKTFGYLLHNIVFANHIIIFSVPLTCFPSPGCEEPVHQDPGLCGFPRQPCGAAHGRSLRRHWSHSSTAGCVWIGERCHPRHVRYHLKGRYMQLIIRPKISDRFQAQIVLFMEKSVGLARSRSILFSELS